MLDATTVKEGLVQTTTSGADHSMSASLIGRLGSSAFGCPRLEVSMSLAGSCFSPESAHRPFHHGIRRRGGTIFWATFPIAVGRSKRTCELTSSIVPRGTPFHHLVELELLLMGSVRCHTAVTSAIDPDTVQDDGQSPRQGDDRLFHPATPGDLHRPSLEPRPFLRAQHTLGRFVEQNPASGR
jgi:hypothetical protein